MKLIIGDILQVTRGTILHQVNCAGVVGGLASSLHAAHLTAFTDYFLLCEKYAGLLSGTAHEGHASHDLSIIHVFGQITPGRCTDMALVHRALASLSGRPHLDPVYAPFRMGCGIGGGDWGQYLAALVRVFPNVIIVQREEDAR